MKPKERPIEYYIRRNQWFECVAVIGWWLVAALVLAMILAKT